MTTNIYAWPPIKARGVEHTVVQPISESISALGAETRYVSTYAKERRVVTLVISGRNNQGSAGGYINMLKRFLKGGRHLVRVSSQPAHFNLDWLDLRGQTPLGWTSTERDMDWTSYGSELTWLSGSVLTGVNTPDGDFDGLVVQGFPPNEVVAYPDEIIWTGGANTARVLKMEKSDSEGQAHIRISRELSSGKVIVGLSESGIFKLTEIPRVVQYAGEDFEYTFELREVFEDEIIDGIEEIDPWR